MNDCDPSQLHLTSLRDHGQFTAARRLPRKYLDVHLSRCKSYLGNAQRDVTCNASSRRWAVHRAFCGDRMISRAWRMWHGLAANYFWLGALEARVAIRVRTAMHDGGQREAAIQEARAAASSSGFIGRPFPRSPT